MIALFVGELGIKEEDVGGGFYFVFIVLALIFVLRLDLFFLLFVVYVFLLFLEMMLYLKNSFLRVVFKGLFSGLLFSFILGFG